MQLTRKFLRRLIIESLIGEAVSDDTTKFYNKIKQNIVDAGRYYGQPKTKEQIRSKRRLKAIYTIFQKPEEQISSQNLDFVLELLGKIKTDDTQANYDDLFKPIYDDVRNFRQAISRAKQDQKPVEDRDSDKWNKYAKAGGDKAKIAELWQEAGANSGGTIEMVESWGKSYSTSFDGFIKFYNDLKKSNNVVGVPKQAGKEISPKYFLSLFKSTLPKTNPTRTKI